MKKIFVWIMGMMLFAGCATTERQKADTGSSAESGFLGEYYKDLKPMPNGAKCWIEPRVNFGKYNKVMIDHVVFVLARDSEYKGIHPDEMMELGNEFHQEIINALRGKYQIVADPGPDVLRFQIAITEIKESKPALSAVSSIIPIALGISLIKRGATGAWIGSGATGAEFLVIDSGSRAVIAACEDKKSAGFTERFSKWGSSKEAFAFWAERIAKYLDETTKKK